MAVPISQIPSRRKGQKTCRHHKDRQLELYCEQCQELACLRCISSTHRSHTMCELCELTPQKKQDITNFVDKTEKNELAQLLKYIASTDSLLQENDSVFEKLSQDLKTQTEKLKQELDALTADTLSLYQEMKQDNVKLIQKYKQDLEMYDEHLKLQMQECKTLLQQGSHLEVYDADCKIDSLKCLPGKPVLRTIGFTPSENPRHYLQLALGEVNTTSQVQAMSDRPLSLADDQLQCSTDQHQPEIQRKTTLYRNRFLEETEVLEEWECPVSKESTGFIASISPTNDGKVWISYESDKRLILLDKKGTVMQEITHKVTIKDICQSPTTNTLWACDEDRDILEVISGTLVRRFGTKDVPTCICVTTSNHIIVGMHIQICKFSSEGQLVLTTKVADTVGPHGSPARFPYRITECPRTNNIAVIVRSSKYGFTKIVIKDKRFQELLVYSGDNPSASVGNFLLNSIFLPTSVVYDSLGNIIIGEGFSNNVLILSACGNFVRTLCNENELRFQHLWPIDPVVKISTGNTLWCSSSNKVKLLQYTP